VVLAVEDIKKLSEKIDMLQKDVDSLKLGLGELKAKPKKVVAIKGMLQGIVIDEKDITAAKRSIFKGA